MNMNESFGKEFEEISNAIREHMLAVWQQQAAISALPDIKEPVTVDKLEEAYLLLHEYQRKLAEDCLRMATMYHYVGLVNRVLENTDTTP